MMGTSECQLLLALVAFAGVVAYVVVRIAAFSVSGCSCLYGAPPRSQVDAGLFRSQESDRPRMLFGPSLDRGF